MSNIWIYLKEHFRKIRNFFRELQEIQSSRSECNILKRYVSSKNVVSYKVQMPRGAFNVSLKAKDIATNPELLEQFSPDDQSQIIIDSGLCAYRLTETTLNNNSAEAPLVTLEARYNDKLFAKKYLATEIYENKQIFSKLTKKEKNFIETIIQQQKVVAVDFELYKKNKKNQGNFN